MAEEVTKVVENIDKLFSEIVVNGESHVSDHYVPPEPAQANTPVEQEEEEQTPSTPQRDTQGEYVKAIQLNNVLHDIKDKALTEAVASLTEAINTQINGITSLIPSEATTSNQLADKSYVGNEITDAIDDLDVAEVGGNGKYIKSIKQEDGKIVAEEDYLSGTGGGVAFVGTRAEYEVAKLIPLGQTGHIPSGSLVIITDEDSYIEGEER